MSNPNGMNPDLVFDPSNETEGWSHQRAQTVDSPWHSVGGENTVDPNTITIPEQNAITRLMKNAVATHERSCTQLVISAATLIGSITPDSPQVGPFKFIDRQIGRRFVILKCPPSNTKGCYIAHSQDGLSSLELGGVVPFAWLLSPSDDPISIPTEAPIWVVGQSGQAANDVIQAIAGIDLLDK